MSCDCGEGSHFHFHPDRKINEATHSFVQFDLMSVCMSVRDTVEIFLVLRSNLTRFLQAYLEMRAP